MDAEKIEDLLFFGVLGVILGGRLGYCFFYQPEFYLAYPSQIIRIWDGGIAIYGALIGALIVLIIFCRQKQISAWLFLDVIAPTVILAQGIGRWGNFINQEAHGGVTSLSFLHQLHLPAFIINQMYINGNYYQPTFLYESLWDVLGFLILISLRHRQGLFKQGEVFLSYVLWYSFGRFFIEGMRTDSLMLGGLRVSQWLSVVLFIVALGIWAYRRYYNPLNAWYVDGSKQDTLQKTK